MTTPRAPDLDKRRSPDFSAELLERARAWVPEWGLADGERDFGRALLEVAARFNSEVAERLDGAGEKMRRGFLDWLAVRGEAARPARMPVVFKLADTAKEAVLAPAPVRLQADAGGTQVVFETEQNVRVVPGRLDVVVGVDADHDAFYLPPPGLSELKAPESLPTQWQLKSFAAAGATKLQLDPEAGLVPGLVIEAGGQHYRIVLVDKDLVTLEPPLDNELGLSTVVSRVTTFSPFDGKARNEQEHALYLGDAELLNVEAEATIEIVGGMALRTGIEWQYWGKREPNEQTGWQSLQFAPDEKQSTVQDAVVLIKPKGAIEPSDVGGRSSRWIRGTTKNIPSPDRTFTIDALKLRINCGNDAPCPPPIAATPGPTAEAMANSTPLVLSEPFYPLGREPRQFDAFYLGCSEAFSKKGATAQICFEMSDATCLAYAVVRGGTQPYKILAGVGKDRALHLFKLDSSGAMTAFRGPLRPPVPAEPGAQVAPSAPVDLNPRCRPVIWNAGDDCSIAVAAGGNIWIWHENLVAPEKSGWKPKNTIPGISDATANIEDIIVLKRSPNEPGAVLSNGRFWVLAGAQWIQPLQPLPQPLPQPPPPAAPLRDYAALAPIYAANGDLTDAVVAVGAADKELYRLEPNGSETAIEPGLRVDVGTVLPGSSFPVGGIRPAAIESGTSLYVVAVSENRDELVAKFKHVPPPVNPPPPPPPQGPQRVSLPAQTVAIGAAVTTADVLGKTQFSVGAKTAAEGAFVASWVPTFIPTDPTALLQSTIPGASGPIGGTPLVAGSYMVVPGGRGDAFVAPFNPSQRLEFMTQKVIVEGVILPAPAPFALNDFISVMPDNPATPRMEWTVTRAPSVRGSEWIYVVDPALGESVADDPQLIGYLAAGVLAGTINTATDFDAVPPDPAVAPGMILRISVVGQPTAFCEVDSVNPVTGKVIVKVTTPLPANNGALSYWKPISSVARVVPAIEFQPTGDGNWSASILDTAKLYFPVAPAGQALQPSPQTATAFGVFGDRPTVVALAHRWTSPPPPLNAPTPLIIDGVTGAWRQQLTDSSSNPALSWEYWSGKGWWSLEVTDRTDRLATTGVVKFTVPQDIAESDWSGKTNFWIRARLVGGDYGREDVKVISKPGKNTGETVQIVERSTDNIKAPQVLDLRISYSICNELLPKFVLAQDSGTIRDQSDANRVGGAIVEAFVPLAVMLGRLSTGIGSPEDNEDCPPECDCGNQPTSPAVTPPSSSAAFAAAVPHESGRCLFIGLDATPFETPVNVLLLVEKENPVSDFAPMTIEALVAGRFVPIVANDVTHALGESGVLSMSFPLKPTLSGLFGTKKNLTWLRLKPKASASGKWAPALRGAFLNAVWASATETLTRELLGSSNGEPHLTVRLARPPVLYQSLKLRVKEPLGEEERVELRQSGENVVLSEEDGLPGDWVLWNQVPDPDDEEATARVYALDESSGEIRFGDGVHGRIPPIGRDSIVAFRYCRTEPNPAGGDSVPGNSIAAGTALNLVSPVETVESVTAADQAAGGAPAESAERILRFGVARLRHRNRAITARDIEDLALQSSPDIVQAHAMARRGFIRLIVVMRGTTPQPSAAQARELRRVLLAAAPVSLSAPGALRVEGPAIRRLRIELKLQVESLDHAGALTEFVKRRLIGFFDTATGGPDEDGWPLGINPDEGDIALALIEARDLQSIQNVTLREITGDGKVGPWPEQLKATEIVMLADDSIGIEFETTEVTA